MLNVLGAICGVAVFFVYIWALSNAWGKALIKWGLIYAPPERSVGTVALRTEDELLAAQRDQHAAEEACNREFEQFKKTTRNSAAYKRAFKYGKAAYRHGHSRHDGPHFKANPSERLGWHEGWEFAADEAVRAEGRDFDKLIVSSPSRAKGS
jgi:hypothetical protein